MSFLDEVVKDKKALVKDLKSKTPLQEIKKIVYGAEKRPFYKAFCRRFPEEAGIIAEIKKASPSKGSLVAELDLRSALCDYASGGAKAISVITEEKYFKGSLAFIPEAKTYTGLPVLRKDFIVDEYELYESKSAGADAVLLIAEVLEARQIAEYIDIARRIDLDVLLEVHSFKAYEKIAGLTGYILGINNRNLENLKVDLAVSVNMLGSIPLTCPVVIESGIETRAHMEMFFEWGVSGFLIGTSLMLSKSPFEKLRELRGMP